MSDAEREESEEDTSGGHPPPNAPQKGAEARSRRPLVLVALTVTLAIAWLVARPGLFVVQPLGAVPDGVTVLYLSRSDDAPFVESPDGICLRTMGGVSLMCRGTAMARFMREAEPSIVARLPYNEWLYLRTTDGQTFDR